MENPQEKLISLLDEYISLISEELDELAIMATNRGWQSSRIKEGEEMRLKIKKARENIDKNTKN